MKDSVLNVGVIGLGVISAVHIPTYQKDSRTRLAAVCDIEKSWLDYQKGNLRVDYAYTDYPNYSSNMTI